MKKILSMILALVMVFALGATAFAAGEVTPPANGTEVAEDDTTKTPDTVAGGTADTTEAAGEKAAAQRTITINNNTAGHTYKAYQIFKGGLSQDGTILSDIQWGNGVNSEALLTALKGTEAYKDCTTAADVAKVLAGFENDAEQLKKVAVVINQNLNNANGAQSTGTGPYTITVPSDGYYLVRDEGTVTATDGGTNFILQVIGNVDVTPKTTNAPDVDKKVKLHGVPGAVLSNAVSAEVGHEVDFTITTTIPTGLDSYTNYTFNIVDTMSEGLTYKGDFLVHTVGAKTSLQKDEDYTLTIEGQTITVTLASKYVLANPGQKIEITYVATVNDKSLTKDRENNSVHIVYSNNPADSNSTVTTVDKVVYVYNFDIVIDKVDGADNKKLEGAQFALYKETGYVDLYYQWYDENHENPNTFGWSTEADRTIVKTDKNGVASFKGLVPGTYYLQEIKAPDGYNTLDKPVKVEITATYDDNGNITTNATPNEQNNHYEVTSTITNNKGTVLPSTGGIGITIFYVVGGLLMVGAAILLITKKRMHNNG
ncbi:MAG: SpaH/EbpB family LPXTG-anchored major pilin [Negativibacillus sp.]|nr:SpaH/EbpB family LPXTG-anchored major pilin [Negativibacillus sp.]